MLSARKTRIGGFRLVLLVAALVLILVGTAAAAATMVPAYDYATPIFGLTTSPAHRLLVADAGAGIVEIGRSDTKLLVELPGVSDMSWAGRGNMFAITGLGPFDNSSTIFHISNRRGTREIADLWAYEEANNPDGGEIDSNPFDVEALSTAYAAVADAGANDLLLVDLKGNVDWIATFPHEIVSTDHIKSLAGCPTPPPGFEFVCGLPDMMPAEAVPTSVAVGPDGAYYVGELKGFPAPVGESRIWRIEPGTLHAECGASPACSVVADGFTSIVDLVFGPDGHLLVVELDEATWAAVEFGVGSVGGTVNSCDLASWTCTEVATGLPIPIAAAIDPFGTTYVAIFALVPGSAEIITLP
jgi:hypothetical protein